MIEFGLSSFYYSAENIAKDSTRMTIIEIRGLIEENWITTENIKILMIEEIMIFREENKI